MKPKVANIILFLYLFIVINLQLKSNAIRLENYLDIVSIYSQFRNIAVWTHLTCFEFKDRVKISARLSASLNVQSRHVTNFRNISRLLDNTTNAGHGYAVDITCKHTFAIFQQEDQKILFQNKNFWILFDEPVAHSGRISAKVLLDAIDVLPISEMMVVQYDLVSAKYFFVDVYKIAKNYPLEISLFGSADASPNSTSLQVTEKFFKKLTRKNLRGIQLRCALVISFPEKFTYMEDPRNANVDVSTKSTFPLMINLGFDLNYTCNIMQTDSYGWLVNGTWDGVMAFYAKHKVDLLLHETSMRVDRMQYVEFTTDFFPINTPIIFRQPMLASVQNIFVLPFRFDVWQACIVAVVMIWLAMLTQYAFPEVRQQMSCLDIVGFIYGAVCQQGTHLKMPKSSGRIIVLTTFLLSLFVFISYSANILVLLQSPSNAIKTLDDFIASPLMLALQDVRYARFIFKYENKGNLKRIYDTKMKPYGGKAWIYDAAKGIEKVRTEMFAFQLESATAYKLIGERFNDDEKCSLTELTVLRVPKLTITIERNSPYKELFRQRLRFQGENGLVARENIKWFPKKPKCESTANKIISVGLIEIQSALFILIFGMGVSVLLLLIEIVLHKLLNRWKPKRITNVLYPRK